MIYYDYREKLTDAGKTRIAVLEKVVPEDMLCCEEMECDYKIKPSIMHQDNYNIADIEVKQISDLVNSAKSGRLQTQLYNCRRLGESILIPEGLINVNAKMNIMSGSYQYNLL